MNVDKTAHLPTAVYRIYDAGDRLIYVGQSQRMGMRMRTHRTASWWFGLMDRVDVEYHPTRDAAVAAEQVAIQEEQPSFNSKHTGRDESDFSHWTEADIHFAKTWLRNNHIRRSCVGRYVRDFLRLRDYREVVRTGWETAA